MKKGISRKAGWAVIIWFFASLLVEVLIGSSENVCAIVLSTLNFAVSAWCLRLVRAEDYFPSLTEDER